MITSSTKTIALIGNVWDPIQGKSLKTLVIANGKITQLMDGKGDLSNLPGITVIQLDANTTIFPGLINLHTHTTYNILPIWESNEVWKNRFQWRNNATYKQDIGGLLDYIQKNWKNDPDQQFVASFSRSVLTELANTNPSAVHLRAPKPSAEAPGGLPQAMPEALPASAVEPAALSSSDALIQSALSQINTAYAIISEIQAVAGGTTLIQETASLDKEPADERSFIIRNTGNQSDLQIPATEQIFSVVDFYKPDATSNGTPDQDTSTWTPAKAGTSYANFINSVNNNNSSYYATLVHVGEGKSGFIKGSTPDPYSKKEVDLLFQSLKTDIPNAANLQKANLTLTHGCGIDLSNDELLTAMAAGNISLIWSPVSNLLLYLDTTDIRKLLDKNINVCLGSDWSPSGSKHVLDELKFAKFVNDLLGLGISAGDLFSMVTTNPVKAMGIGNTGAIRENFNADLFVLRKKDAAGNALDALLASDDSDIDLVMVNGRIVFGLTSYFKDQLQVDFQPFPAAEGNNAAQRGVSINSVLQFNLASSLNSIDTLLQRYCTTVIDQPQLKRTKFLASDDTVYAGNINALKQQLTKLYNP
jgi:5-methylthioadenosine/S-adenosylhomocysteine deaminase